MKKINGKKIFIKMQALILSLVLIMTLIPLQYVFAEDTQDQTANSDIIRTMTLSYKLKGETTYTTLNPDDKIKDITKIESFKANCFFSIKDYVDDTSGGASRTVKSGDYYLIDLPENLVISNAASGTILGNDKKAIANYSFIEESKNNWKIKIEFTNYVDNSNEWKIYGQMDFDFALDLSAIGEGSTTTVYIPIDNNNGISIEVTNPVPPPTKPVSLLKTVSSYNHETRELIWNVQMKPDTGIFSGCIFTDTLDITKLDLKSIKHGSVTLVEGVDKDYTYNPLTGEIVYTIPEGRNGANYQNITLTTVAKRDIYGKLTATTITNQANLSGGQSFVNIDSNEASRVITPNWFGKTGTVYQGNKIKWTLKANTTKQQMYNAVITDYLQSDVKLDKNSVKLGNTDIPVYDGSHSPATDKEVYGVYTQNPDGTAILQIYLPRGKENASTVEQTITFVTDVKAPDTVLSTDKKYNNRASLDANYVTDGNGEGTLPTINLEQIGVAVPYISVVKSHKTISDEDKRNGTISWTIAASSNLSDYGKSTIVDTLPADQDYIADEIYCGTNKINNTTEPKAEISGDGRTLTITFNNHNALSTQQIITVKTKIRQNIYGDNFTGRIFRNAAEGKLYSAVTEGEVLDSDASSDSVTITNTVISKASSEYTGNTTQQGQNPRVNFSITINSNLMPLSDVVVTDDLKNLITEFQKNGQSNIQVVDNVKWTYVPGTLNIQKSSGTLDSLDLAAIKANATYINDVITVDFGNGVQVNDKYTITFTAELDVSQNAIFKENGTITCKGNIADITAIGLKGKISTSPTDGSNEIKNEVLGKSGVHNVENQQAVWTINLNQHRVTLDSSRVVDILPLGLTLDPTSIKLYTKVIGPSGNFISGEEAASQNNTVPFTYTYEPATEEGMEGRYKLTVQLPSNKTDYILRFATDIDNRLLGKEITNSAYYVGESNESQNTDTRTMTFSGSSGGGSTTKSAITVYKKSKDTGASLDTATFALYWLRNGNPNDAVFVRTLATSGGSVIFRGLTKGEKYSIVEISPPSGYIIDNPNPVEFTVPITGTEAVDPLTFYNTPKKSGSWTPAAIKKLDGKNIIHPFNFEINDGINTLMAGVTQTLLAGGNYTVAFAMKEGVDAKDILHFTDEHIFENTDPAGTEYLIAEKEKTLFMKEIPSALPGYGFDNTVYKLVVKVYNVKGQSDLKIVVEDGNGRVLSDDSGNFTAEHTPVFLNTYRADGSIALSAEKTVVGHSLAAAGFSFELYEGTTLLQTVSNGTGALIGGNTYSGNVNFAAISYNQNDVGTKTYRIVEKNTSLPGYTYDPAEYTVTVKIDDNDDGTLTSAIQSIQKTVGGITTTESKVAFTNIYTTSDADVNLSASKTLSGRAIADGQFSFKLNQVAPDGTFIKEIGTVTNIGETVALPKLTFVQSDIGNTYYYQVSEMNLANPGYTYDDSVYTVKIDITDNDDGTISAAASYTKSGQPASAITFANRYTASGDTTVTAAKVLNGKSLPENQFAFALQQYDPLSGAPLGTESVVRNTASGAIVFPKLLFTEDDAGKEFYYKVTEVNEAIGGYSYDSTVYRIKISVTDNGDGTLSVQQEITEPSGVTAILFFNTYKAEDTFTQLTAQKNLNGRILEDKQFQFVLNQVTETGELIREVQRVQNNLQGAATFADLSYTQADMGKIYYYQISESQDNHSGYTYDPAVYSVKIEVIDNNNGTLTAQKSIQKDGQNISDIVFTNAYATASTTADFTAQKILNGRILENEQFSYVLTLKGESIGTDRVLETVKNTADATVSFAPVTYTQADMGKSYTYTITEVNDYKPGYTYDSTVYTVTVDVVDNGDGTLTAQKSIQKDGQNISDIVFTNTYTTADTTANFSAQKMLFGRILEKEQFSYVLTLKGSGTDGDRILETVKNTADGMISFAPVTYTQADMGKSFTYTIAEVNDNKPGYTYDSTTYTVTVDVVDNGDGTLTAQQVIEKEENTVLSAVFTNSYATTNTVVPFAAQKTLSGRKLADKQFSYILTQKGTGAEADRIIETVKNGADGAILFTPMVYTQSDMGKTFTYTIAEVNDNRPGYTYDNTVYTVIVIIVDNGDGTLSTEVTVTKPDGNSGSAAVKALTFSNSYTANGSVQFHAVKQLKGAALSDKMFTFVLADSNGTVLQTAYNDKDGTIIFDKLFFNQTQLGEYHYKIYEVSGDSKSYIYDTTVYLLTVTVTDNDDGTLNASTVITRETKEAKATVQSMEFVNEYVTPKQASNPKTGENSAAALCGFLILLSSAAILLTKHKKINNN